MSHITLIVKATRLCNLRCSYCHDWRASGERMNFTVLAHMTARALREFDWAEFVWHGGETTLLPIQFYEKAMAIQARFLRPGCRVSNSLQTNATRLDDKWAKFLKGASFRVGISLDGPREIHDGYRLYAGGRGSFDDAVRGIEVLRKYQVGFGLLLVVDEGILALGPDRVFDFFLEHRIKSVSCLSVKPDNVPNASPGTPIHPYLDPPRMTGFLTRLYDRWLEHGDRTIVIRELAALEARIRGDGLRTCTLEGNCLGQYFLVEPSGDVAHCDLFLGDPAYTLGNITQMSFSEMSRSPQMMPLKDANDRALRVMREHCPEFKTCSGWCPHERYISYRHNAAHSEKCCGLYALISHIKSRMRDCATPSDSWTSRVHQLA